MALPVPDFDDSDEEDPSAPSASSHPEMLTLSVLCDPNHTFTSRTPNGLQYDPSHPLYHTKSCTLYVAHSGTAFFALKTSRSPRLLAHEWEMFNAVGKFPTIIDALDYWQEDDIGFIQLDFAFGGAITNIVGFLSPNDSWRILAHISYALAKIHSCGYLHLDVSPSNILLMNGFDECSIYKLADFGTVIQNGTFGEFCEGAGPYVSPEALEWPNTQFEVSYPADIWSFGAVMFEIVTHRKMPRDPEGYDGIRRGTYDLSMIPDQFAIVRSMLDPHPGARPTAEMIVALPNVQQVLSRLDQDVEQSTDVMSFLERDSATDLQRRQSFDTF